jgi:hypothetical protein
MSQEVAGFIHLRVVCVVSCSPGSTRPPRGSIVTGSHPPPLGTQPEPSADI